MTEYGWISKLLRYFSATREGCRVNLKMNLVFADQLQTVLALEDASILTCLRLRAITFHSNTKTQWQIFLRLYGPSEWHKHGVSIKRSINLGDGLLRIMLEWSDSWPRSSLYSDHLSHPRFLTSTIFNFDHMTGEKRKRTPQPANNIRILVRAAIVVLRFCRVRYARK